MKKVTITFMMAMLLLAMICPVGLAAGEQNMGTDMSAVSSASSGATIGSQYVTLKNPGKGVFVKNRAGQWVPAADGMVVLPGDEIKTEKDSTVEVVLDGGKVGHVELKEGSLFKILQAETNLVTGDKKTLLDLAVGKILIKAEALTGSSKFEVRTPSAIAGVRGTLFEVEVKGGKAS